jgi:DNA helicase-2/ATP-dependent DNA helicase PcrA
MGNGAVGPPPEGPTPEQQRFIDRALHSHALLVAGPGTGKTRGLAYAAARVQQEGVPPENLVVVTLTRALANSLSQRIPNCKASTLHSFALANLNRLGAAWGRRVVDRWSEENFVRTDLQLGVAHDFGQRPTLPQVEKFFTALGAAFREGQDEPANMDVVQQRLWQVFRNQRELFRYRLMDELVIDLVDLVEQGHELDPLPTHVFVDEYQDLTAGELRLLQLLAQRGTRIIAAGDDRQSIYRFREADQRALHRFGEVYGVALDALTESWRCPRRICEFAEAVAQPLPALPDFVRPPLTPRPGRPDEGEIKLLTARSPTAEARWIIGECRRLMGEGTRACDIMLVVPKFFDAVFAELKEQADAIAELPFAFYDPRGTDPAASDPAVRLLGAGARILADPQDQIAWRTLVWATLQLGETRLTTLLTANQGDYKRNLEHVAAGNAVCRRPLAAGQAAIAQFNGQAEVNARELVTLLARELGREGLDLTLLARAEEEAGGPIASPATWAGVVVELSQPTLIGPAERPDDIPVRTIFGAKGLESSVAFLVSAIEAAFTGEHAADDIRRLFVAVTRAEHKLYITASRSLRYTRLGNTAGVNAGGLSPLITAAAARVDIQTGVLP